MSWYYIEGILIQSCYTLLIVLGLSILTGYTGMFSFGHAGFVCIGAYVSVICTMALGLPFWLALLIAGLTSMALGTALGKITLGLKGDYFCIATLGVGEAIRLIFNNLNISINVGGTPFVLDGAKGIASIPLKSLSTDDLQDFISFLKKSGKLDGSGGLSNKTIRNIMTMIRTALKQAMGNQLIWTNPADYCQLPKVKQTEKQFLTVDEMERLLRAAKGERWYIGLLLLLMTGCRLGELLALRHNSFHCENGLRVLDIHHAVKRVTNFHAKPGEPKTVLEISEPKSDKSYRTIPILPEVAELVQAHIQMQQQLPVMDYTRTTHFSFLTSLVRSLIRPRSEHGSKAS